MKRKGYYVMLTALLIVLLGVGGAIAQEEPPERGNQGSLPPPATVSSKIHFQGVLKESGSPVTGNRDIIFRLFSNSACTNQVGSNIVKNGVSVTDGLFAVALEVTHSHFNGEERWIEPEVGGVKIGCHEILPVPYALSLRPGARVVGDQTGWNAIYASNTATTGASYGIRGDSASTIGRGVFGYASATTGTNYGVRGESDSDIGRGVYGEANVTTGTNYGVYGFTDSVNGIGVAGFQTGYSTGDSEPLFWKPGGLFGGNNGVIGISKLTNGVGAGGWSKHATGPNYGVYGQTESTAGIGVYGLANATTGTTYGVYGQSNSTDGFGVYGLHDADSGTNPGVYGETDSTSNSAAGVTGRVDPTNAGGFSAGVRGINDGTGSYGIGVWGSQDGSGWGVYGLVDGSGYGVHGRAEGDSGRGVYGWGTANSGSRVGVRGEVNGSGYGLYTGDNLYVGGSCTGCTIVFISTNASQEMLRVGDAVAVSGVGPVLKGHSVPVLEVRRAMASDVSVLGVVHSRGEFYAANGDQSEDDDSVQPVEGDVAPGDYLLVVTSGLAQVRVAPTLTALTPGQPLTIGAIAGRAALAGADAEPGTVFARAMEAQPDENGLVWAMIGGR